MSDVKIKGSRDSGARAQGECEFWELRVAGCVDGVVLGGEVGGGAAVVVACLGGEALGGGGGCVCYVE